MVRAGPKEGVHLAAAGPMGVVRLNNKHSVQVSYSAVIFPSKHP